MSSRNQPYLPLYIQDFLTDEKLIECSASATGIYIRIMCVMHKSQEYGKILLQQKDKQNESICLNFACKLAKYLPYKLDEILDGINELVNNQVLNIEGDYLIQKRMVKDNKISQLRSIAGKKGGIKTSQIKGDFAVNFAKAKNQANVVANSENENENENKGGVGGRIEIAQNDFACYNVEELMTQNKAQLEAICMKAGKSMAVALDELMKCHLHLEKKQMYPMGKKAAVAWFTSWLLNSEDFNAKYRLASSQKKKPAEPPKKNIDEILKKYK